MDELTMSFIFFLVILALIFVVWVVIDLFQKDYSMTEKLLWLIVIIMAPLIGSFLYFIFGRNREQSS